MKKLVLAVFVIGLIFIIGIIMIGLNSRTGKVILSTGGLKDSDDSKTESDKTNSEETSEKVSGDKATGGSSAGAGAGGGGSSGGGGTSGTTGQATSEVIPPNCDEQQISYAIRNFNFYSICNEYNEDICISKLVNCSAEVDNLDYETSGEFEIQFTFLDENRNTIDTKLQSYFLEPKTSRVFEGIAELTNGDENFNKEVSCSYATIKIPAKKVC